MIQETQNTFSSSGNLIITGEYFVLTGAKALAVPLKYNQRMNVRCLANSKNLIQWEAIELGQPWFNSHLSSDDIDILSSNNTELALGLQKILKALVKLKPLLFSKDILYQFSCDIQFSTSWGWGSSSTLISNIANWAGIDPFELNKEISSGSGYDIAASNSATPILYQLNENGREIISVAFNPVFKKNIYFIYLGKKQNTSTSIEKNFEAVKRENIAPVITLLTEKIAKEDNMNEFIRYIVEHEIIISKTLKTPRVKEEYFNDFDGEIKSLGGWGGDFAMVVSPLPEAHVRSYFKSKGLETFFRFDEIVKN